MTSNSISIPQTKENKFRTGQVLTVAGSHLIHDIYTSCLAPLLPVIIQKLSLSLTMAGSLSAIMQIPAVLNPFIGYIADKVSLRYLVILTPAITATLISSLGFAPDYASLAIILFVAGISVAAFHAPTPVMVSHLSGKQVGKGMSLYMAGGELARAIGPILTVWAISTWTLDGFYRIAVLGWAASIILFLRLRNMSTKLEKPGSLRAIAPFLRRLFLPVLIFGFFKNFMTVSLITYLPTFMKMEGASLILAGGALSILELAGVGGALLSGTVSDKVGRKPVLLTAIVASSILMLVFLRVDGWLLVPVLLGLGFTAQSTAPVMLAIVQEQLPNNRAVGNGLFISISFLLRPLIILLIGIIGDHLGLRSAYFWSAILSLAAIPAIFALPNLSDNEAHSTA